MYRVCYFTFLWILMAFFYSPVAGADQVVYSNLSHATTGDYAPAGYVAFSRYDNYEPIGDEINLSEGGDLLKEFHLMLSSSVPTVLDSVSLSLVNNDGVVEWMGGYPYGPGKGLWSSTLYNVAVNGPTEVVFTVPEGTKVILPDTLTWLVCAGSDVAGLATYDPPTVGSSPNYFWGFSGQDNNWYIQGLSHQVANFGASVIAVPEPVSAGLLLAGGLAVLRRRRGW